MSTYMTTNALRWTGAVVAIGIAAWLLFLAIPRDREAAFSINTEATSTEQKVWECNADGKICPDGSLVGRTGERCEFAACPPEDATSASVTTYLGGSPTALHVTVNPREIISDSRCPEGVQCIWAGTVEVRTALSTEVSHGEHVLTLGEPQRFGDFNVTLVGVSPQPVAGDEIPDSSYRFTFEIARQ